MIGDLYRLKKLIPILFLGVFLMSSCSYKNTAHLLKFPESINTDTLKTIAVSNPTQNYDVYKIKPFDLISVRNLQDPALLGSRVGDVGTLSINYRVTNEGEIILPVIGSVIVSGLTREEAKNKIQSLYAESLFKDPIIELTINSLKVTLLGFFNSQGNFIIENENFDLIDIIGKAGGISDDANIKNIRIIRGDRKNPELITVNLADINTISSLKLKLQDGDIIIAERNKFANLIRGAQSISAISSLALIVLNSYVILRTLDR